MIARRYASFDTYAAGAYCDDNAMISSKTCWSYVLMLELRIVVILSHPRHRLLHLY